MCSILSSIGKEPYAIDISLKINGWNYPVVLDPDQTEKLNDIHFEIPSSLTVKRMDEVFYDSIKNFDQIFEESRLEYTRKISEAKDLDIAAINEKNLKGGWSVMPMIKGAAGFVAGGVGGFILNQLPWLSLATDIYFLGHEYLMGPPEVKVPLSPIARTLRERCSEYAKLEDAINGIDFSSVKNTDAKKIYLDLLKKVAEDIQNGVSYKPSVAELWKKVSKCKLRGAKIASQECVAFYKLKNLTLLPEFHEVVTTEVKKESANPSEQSQANKVMNGLFVAGMATYWGYNSYTQSTENMKLVCDHRVKYLTGDFYEKELARQNNLIKTVFDRSKVLFEKLGDNNKQWCNQEILELKQLNSLYTKTNRVDQLVVSRQGLVQKGISIHLEQGEKTLADYLKNI